MKTKKFKITMISFIIIILLITVFNTTKKEKFKGNINLNKYNIVKKISDSKQMETLGNYMFLYSAHSSIDPQEDLSSYNSYLVITDFEKNIKEIIDLGDYYQYIDMKENGDILLYNDLKDVHIMPYVDNQYKEIKETNLKTLPNAPYVGVVGSGSIFIDQNKYVEFKNEPFSNYNQHKYLVVDFVQNTYRDEEQIPDLRF